MKAAPSSSPASHRFIRLPLLGLAAVLCMGSGLGNPGRGSSGPTHCTELCAVEGNPNGVELEATLDIGGEFDPQPADTSAPSVLKGTYWLHTTQQSENDLTCDVKRAFTATR